MQELPGTSAEASRTLSFSTRGSYQPVRPDSPSDFRRCGSTADKKPTPTTFVSGPQAPPWAPAGTVSLSQQGPSWPPAGMVPSSRPAKADASRHSSVREAHATMMLDVQSVPSSSRQDRRFQNTYEDGPFELQQRLPHHVQAFETPLHNKHLRQDQFYAQIRATTNAPATVSAATVNTYSVVTVTSSTAPSVSQQALRTAKRVYPTDTSGFGPLPIQASVASCTDVSGFGPLPIQDFQCNAQPFRPNMTSPAQQLQYDDLHLQTQCTQHHVQPMPCSAAGGRGSSGAPPVGPAVDYAVDNDYEATSAFYRNATFHCATPDSAPSPLILTELPIEPFDGDVRRYPTFRNHFLDVVEGQNLAPRLKLQYLLQFLRGEPYQLASDFQLTDANYYIIVDRLEEQYGDKYRLRQRLAQDFIAMRPPAGGVADLRRFHDVAFRISKELRTQGENIDATVLYEQTLMAKLPLKLKEEIVRNSEYRREKTVKSILDGLREYANVLDAVCNSGIMFRPPPPAQPVAASRERLHSPPARSPSECSSEESAESSEVAEAEQTTSCVAKAATTRPTEERWRCQLCGLPHVADNCTTYATVTQRVRRIQKLVLCLYCLGKGHRVDTCPQKGLDLCRICHDGNHHRAVCRAAADGTGSRPLRRNSKCAKRGSSSVRKRSVPKRHVRKACEARSVTSSVAAARKLRRSGTQRRPTQIVDNPNKRHAPVKKAVHRSDSRRSKSTAPKPVPSSAPRHHRENKPRASPDRENKPRASPTTQGQPRNGTNSNKIYRKKKSGNAGTSSQGRGSTTRPSTTSTDESVKQKGVNACDLERRLAALEALATARRSTSNDSPRLDRPDAGSRKSPAREWDPFGDEPWEEDESYPTSVGHCSDVSSYGPPDAETDDHNRFPTYKEVRAYVASASTNDAHAPLHECLKVAATNPVNGAVREAIVFFDSGSTFSYISPTLARDLDPPVQGKCVLRVNTFGTPAPTNVEGASTSVVLCSPQGRQVSLCATTADVAIPSVRTALVEETDLPLLRRNERSLSPTDIMPDILIGQDRIQLFGRRHRQRLPAGFDLVDTILGPTIGGAPQVVSNEAKAVSSSSARPAAEATGPRNRFLSQSPSGTTDLSPPEIVLSPTPTSSFRPPLKADNHPCQQNELQGVTTSSTLFAEKQALLERTERSKLLQRTRNPLDTARPPQSGLHTIHAVLQPKLNQGHQPAAEDHQQRNHHLRVSTEQTSALTKNNEAHHEDPTQMPHDRTRPKGTELGPSSEVEVPSGAAPRASADANRAAIRSTSAEC